MSEAAAPAAPAPAAATQSAAPVEGQQPAPVEVDPYAEFDSLLKAKQPKYKAGKKEKVATSMKDLLRKAEMADGIQDRAEALAEKERKAEAVIERDSRLKQARSPREKIAILREFARETGGVDFDELAEEAVMERIEREKSFSGLSPAERAAREEAEGLRAKLSEYESEKLEREEAEKSAKEKAEDAELLNEVSGHALRALQALKLPKAAVSDATRRLAIRMSRAAHLGLDLTPEELAGEAVQSAGVDFRSYTEGLDGDALLEFLGEAAAKKASKALLAKHLGAQSAPPVVSQQSKPPAQGERRSAMSDWRDLTRGR